MEIPIQNIYYLLCYSWNKLEEREIVNIDATAFNNVWDLYAKILINGCTHLLKMGLDRNYVKTSEAIKGIRGKIDFAASLKQNLLPNAKVYCTYDELDYNVLHNQILKSTIERLIKSQNLDKKLKEQLIPIFKKFDEISLIKIKSRYFERVVLHSNNQFYDFLLKICQIIHDHILITEDEGKYTFSSFLKDEKRMMSVFEHFVRNFYRKEQSRYLVKSEKIKWHATAAQESSIDRLPTMQTDITLTSPTRKIIIDTKYYLEALTKRYDKEKIRSPHLNQMYAYLHNSAYLGGVNRNCEGVLLYPTVNQELSDSFQIGAHKLTIQTVDLNQHWQNIHSTLMKILD